MTCGIYRITHIASGKYYLGSSANIEQRWKDHSRDLNAGKHYNPILQRAYSKYGCDAFSFEILLVCAENERLDLEQQYLDNEMPTGLLYNINPIARRPPGGKPGMGVGRKMPTGAIKQAVLTRRQNGGYKKSPETIAKLRMLWTDDRRVALKSRTIRQVSDETRRKMRLAKLGKQRPTEAIEKFKATMAAKTPEEEAARVAKIVATTREKRAVKSPEELAEHEARRQEKRRVTESAKSAAEKSEIRARATATRKARSLEDEAASAQKLRDKWAAKSPEEVKEIAARRWATRRAKRGVTCQL